MQPVGADPAGFGAEMNESIKNAQLLNNRLMSPVDDEHPERHV